MNSRLRFALAAVVLAGVARSTLAQETVARRAPLNGGVAVPSVRTATDPFRLDGRMDERDWALADSITDFRQKEPVEGGTPSERTVVRLLATAGGLAIGWWCYDRHPEGIVRTQLRRDAELRSDDYVSMMIDGLSDQRSAFYFRTNANGALWDGEHINTENGNEEWDGVWDARAQITDEGWTAEMLIPWATLRYRRDVASMGMNFRRFFPRTNEEILWRSWRRTEGLRFLEREGTVAGFQQLPRRAYADFRPFVVAEARAAERSFASDGSEVVTARSREVANVGLDVKIPVTGTLTADITVRPDFAQADVDRQIVNLTRFPLFFPERRTFFTEGAGIFAFGREQQTQLFYSRRIGLGAGGTLVDIPLGTRLQGRVGKYQLGFLAVGTGDGEDARNVVGRVRRDVLGRGYVGAMTSVSDRSSRPGSVAGGADFNFPFIVAGGNNLVFLGNAAWSRDSTGGATGGHYRFVIDYPNDRADIVTRFDRVDEHYDPALGFVLQRGIYRWGGSTAITPRPRNARVVRRYEFNLLNYDVVWDLDRTLDNASFTVKPFGATFQTGDAIELNLVRRFDAPDQPFEIVDGNVVAPGEYWWNRVELEYDGANFRRWSLDASASAGEFYDGRRTDLQLAGRIRYQPHLEFSLEGERNIVSLSGGAFTTNTLRFRGDYAASPRLTATVFAQVDDESDRAALNARVRWTQSPGSDLFLVWNSVWPVGLERASLIRPQRGGFVVKYVRFFRP